MIWSDRQPIHLEPLGDQAVLATLPQEAGAYRLAQAVRQLNPPWLVDVVQAYVTVAVYYNLEQTDYETAAAELRQVRLSRKAEAGRLHVIPCCYERALDLQRVAGVTGLPADEVIRLHSTSEFTVYAIGFCPGFPYLGYLPAPLCGVPRLEQPRLRVEPGSVGLTGRQTGIYPLPRPGGWNLIGQTPLVLVDIEDNYFPLRAGDRVRFARIDDAEFQRLHGQRLPYQAPPG
jgi:inhibitor of KinA